MGPVDPAGRTVCELSMLSESALRKELVIARGTLARLKICCEVKRMQAWSTQVGYMARVAALAWAVSSGVRAWQQHHSHAGTASQWAEVLKLMSKLVWSVRWG